MKLSDARTLPPKSDSIRAGHADAVHAMSELNALLPQADFVALTCPLTAETEKLIDAHAHRVPQHPNVALTRCPDGALRGQLVDDR